MKKINLCYGQTSSADPPKESTPIIGWYNNDPVPYMVYRKEDKYYCNDKCDNDSLMISQPDYWMYVPGLMVSIDK